MWKTISIWLHKQVSLIPSPLLKVKKLKLKTLKVLSLFTPVFFALLLLNPPFQCVLIPPIPLKLLFSMSSKITTLLNPVALPSPHITEFTFNKWQASWSHSVLWNIIWISPICFLFGHFFSLPLAKTTVADFAYCLLNCLYVKCNNIFQKLGCMSHMLYYSLCFITPSYHISTMLVLIYL